MTNRNFTFRALPGLAVTILIGAGALSAGAQKGHVPVQGHGGQYRYVYGGGGIQQQSPVQITHQTLKNAIRVMESALPIYDGHRHRAIEMARLAEQELRQAVIGARGGATQTSAQRMRPAQRAAQIPKRPEIAAARYSAQQIQASHARMQQGIQLLQLGVQQLQSLGRDPDNHVSDAAEFASMGAQAANQGLQFVSTRR